MDSQIPAGAIPVDQFEAAVETPQAQQVKPIATQQAPQGVPEGAIPVDQFESSEDKYGSVGQQIKAGLEGVARGVAGPLAPLIETKLLGVNPEDIRGRAEENPITHGIGEATGLIGGLFTGVGEAALAAKAGLRAAEAVGLGSKALEGGSILSKIGAEALDQGVQAALLQGSDELSKMIIQDPQATAENAVANIGMATALGGALGAGVGAVSPLFKAAAEKVGVNKILGDFTNAAKFDINNPDKAAKAADELLGLHQGTQELKESLFRTGVKGDLIKGTMPELNPKNTEVIKSQVDNVLGHLDNYIEKTADNLKTAGQAKNLMQDRIEFLDKINKADTYEAAYDAINDLKRQVQQYAKAGKAYNADATASAFGEMASSLATKLKPVLEDEKIWGKAAGIQKEMNAAFHAFEASKAEKDFLKTFTNKVGEDVVINPAKVETFIKQAGSPKAEIKNEILENYLKERSVFSEKINKVMVANGKDPVIPELDTTMLNKLLETKTEGQKLWELVKDKVSGEVLGKSAAAAAGSAVAGPVGAVAGPLILGNTFTKMADKLVGFMIKGPANSEGVKSALDFVTAAVKADSTLTKGAQAVFKGGSMAAINTSVNAVEREKLDKVVDKLQKDPQALMKINNGQLANIMPQHQTALTETTARAAQYLASLKPHPQTASPLDKPLEPSDSEKARYYRALDIAQKPLVILEHIKHGTLQANDIQDLQAMYPSLYKQIVNKLTNEITTIHGAGQQIPYKTRMSLALLMGSDLDSTMKPQAIQSAQAALAPNAPAQMQGKAPGAAKNTKNLGKTADSYRTPLQASEAQDTKRK